MIARLRRLLQESLRDSLRWRLLALTLAGICVALLLAGWGLSALFTRHVERQTEAMLRLQLDQLTAHVERAADGSPQVDATALIDPRWRRPSSGLYWQIDTPARRGALRSRSLWDSALALPGEPPAAGELHVHRISGPYEPALIVLERVVVPPDAVSPDGASPALTLPARAQPSWRLAVAVDAAEVEAATRPFIGSLAASLAVLGLLLTLAALAQVRLGLAPLRGLQRALAELRDGRQPRLSPPSTGAAFPAEIRPLIDDFNQVLERQSQWIARARSQAGNLAHAVKTPLAVLANQAAPHAQADGALGELARGVAEQVETARRQVDWHLARARSAALAGRSGLRTPVAPLVDALVRVMDKVHQDRGLHIEWDGDPPELAFLGEQQDLQELLGNLIDNACKWARRRVQVDAAWEPGDAAAGHATGRLRLRVDDDGPGLDAAQREAVLQRGVRADEQVPGHGLGLAIVRESVALHGGDLRLSIGPLGGLRVEVWLPGAVDPAGSGPDGGLR
ncbi:ATP-binding protein [Leptothrix discophora]|uniref:histidine kinase n=1 Tax=Leptothrix discophora TaxID=89 RepID=A0ABT9G7H7_LEPDI|nr:sensor histidine kinase [Leptothrix discophora]MDP4302457.1 sensor histidine kinase [Leptothrix discophora]